MEEYLAAYENYLLQNFTQSTVDKHSRVISYGIEYICLHHDVAGFEDITFGMISSKLYYSFDSNTQEGKWCNLC